MYFIVGKGYRYNEGNRVQTNIAGKSISHFDRGTFLGYSEKPFWLIIKNDRTGKKELFHSSDVVPDPDGVKINQ